MDMVFAVPLEDALRSAAAEGVSSYFCADTGAAGATGELRRLLALMLNVATPLFLAFSAGLMAASFFACSNKPPSGTSIRI